MGQKVNPIGFRLGTSKKQNANWYAKGKDFSTNLIQEDNLDMNTELDELNITIGNKTLLTDKIKKLLITMLTIETKNKKFVPCTIFFVSRIVNKG